MIILHLVLLNWIYFHLGLSNAGPWYAFWGGFGSDIGELSIFLAMGTMIAHQARIHNCEVHRCWRLKCADGITRQIISPQRTLQPRTTLR
jgi:hypothetical protein